MITPELLGFEPTGPRSWTKTVLERVAEFRLLTTIAETTPLEELQRSVMGVSSDLDIYAGNELIILPETGGHVIGAFLDGEMAGALFGFGGYLNGVPRIVSDWMGVWPRFRSVGLGAEIKKLQAAIAFEAGFQEVVWTVDPLRAANARLNIERLGAFSHDYEENRYGSDYAPGLYGGLPTDRLHMTWPIAEAGVHERLLGKVPPLSNSDIVELDHYNPDRPEQRALVYIPTDIDTILQTDPNGAMRWRLTIRETLQRAFDDGYAIRGFVPNVASDGEISAFVIERNAGGARG
jgi:predicted GNAT superfamily acetyltransferase